MAGFSFGERLHCSVEKGWRHESPPYCRKSRHWWTPAVSATQYLLTFRQLVKFEWSYLHHRLWLRVGAQVRQA